MKLISLLRDETGATAIEYGLLVALIAIALVGALTATGNSLSDTFGRVDTTLAAANSN